MTDWIVAGLEEQLYRFGCFVFVAGALTVGALYGAWRGIAWLIAHVQFT